MPHKDKVLSEDPFNLYDILNNRKDSGDDLKYPPGFTLTVINVEEVNKKVKGDTTNEVNEHLNSASNKIQESVPKGKLSLNNSVCSKRVHTGSSILQLTDELVKVGQTMSYNMEGCMWNIEVIIGSQGECNVETKMESMELVTIKMLWSNSSFDYALSSSLGNLGGILCVYEPTLFVKDNVSLSDNFLVVMDRWDGDCVITGDFNEFRTEQERYGLFFNVQCANALNRFISLESLIDLPLDGYAYTWAHKTANKMSNFDRFLVSKSLLASFLYLSALCLDRYLSDHRHILMRELSIDYGPTPFRFIYSWFDLDGFDKMVEDTQKSLATVDSNEGDENTKFFHGILDSKRSQLAICGALVDGEWIVDPLAVKSVFLKYFSTQFSPSVSPRICFADQFTNSPDGFTFEFFRRYWKLLEHDIMAAVKEFFASDLALSSQHKKFKSVVFKVNFEKAFDSIRWDYLQDILKKFSFGDKWCGWINGCLNSAMGSILINGSPKSEFQFHKGFFSGILIDSSLTLSHPFFADDAIFVGKCDSLNICTIVNVLKCFHLASNLKINFHKSKLIGIRTRPEEVDAAATTMGCSIFTTLFVHLGVKVGAIYGEDGALNSPNYLSKRSPWLDIIREVTVLRTKGINLLDLIRKKVGNRLNTLFWEDHWLDDLALKHKFPRLYAFDNYKQIIVVEKTNHASMVDTFRRPSRGGAEEELDDDVLLNAPVVESSKRLALGWINEVDVRESSVGKNDNVNVVGSSKSLALGWINKADVGESSLGKNDNVNVDENVHEEQTVNVNDYIIDDMFELDIDENLNLDDYTVYVDENVNVNENVDENVNRDDENVNADDEYEQGDVDDEEVIGNDREDFIMDEEHVIDEVEVNMEGFTFSVQEQGAEQTVTPNVDLTDEALEVLDFDSFDNDVGDDTKANPNTTVKIDVYRDHNPHENVRRFKRIYVCLGAFGRQLLGLDGAFMKGNYPGQLLTLVSVDANNGIYPVAYGIVESESKESWTWFLSCLGDDLDLEANSNFTFITDRQKGLLPALKDLFPAAEHRYCVRHIHDNINLIYKGGHYKELLWKCATATTEIIICRQLLEARDSPVITALEYVRKYLMKRIVIVQKVNEGRQNQVVVNLANRSCTCRKWEVSGIPCKHAIACIFNMNDNEMQVALPKDWVGRPSKKRKKSVGEVNEMVKDGKLIRKGGTVSCCKCGQKGHNKISCKGTSVVGSRSASASASQPARAKQPQRQPQRALTCKCLCMYTQTNQANQNKECCCKWITWCKEDPNKAEPKTKSCKEDPNNKVYKLKNLFKVWQC
ncbi:RNA-directed DNA polymerase, eukaryota [Tanacetum coccineum]